VQRLAVEVVFDVERPEPAAAGERVGHEVRRPRRIRRARHIQRHALAFGQAAPDGAAAIQSHGLVNPIDALVVPFWSAPSQQLPALPETSGRPVFDQLGRIVAAALFSRIWVPVGNTGGADVSTFRPMPMPDDLQALLAEVDPTTRR